MCDLVNFDWTHLAGGGKFRIGPRMTREEMERGRERDGEEKVELMGSRVARCELIQR